MEEAVLWRIKLGSRSGKPAPCRQCCQIINSMMCVCVCLWQFHDLLSQTTSPLSQMDPYTSRSMDMLLPLTESDRRRRGVDQDCSVSLRSYSERPRSVVSSTVFWTRIIFLEFPCWQHHSLPKLLIQVKRRSMCRLELRQPSSHRIML